jgi:aspartate/glutamate racemase
MTPDGKPLIVLMHTSLVTMKSIVEDTLGEMIPEAVVKNVMDDTLLMDVMAHPEGPTHNVKRRCAEYAMAAQDAGADVIFNVCSSVREAYHLAKEVVDVPLLNIDEPMAEAAIGRGTKIGMVATGRSTFEPTTRLLYQKAEEAGVEIAVERTLLQEAFDALVAGDEQKHNDLLVGEITRLAGICDVVVLAQGSMARVVPLLPPEVQRKTITSPRLSVERARALLKERLADVAVAA